MIDVQRPRAAGHTRRPRRHVPTVYNIWRCVSMTKRWLSLVLVLTLLSTLFTGVAYAAGYDLTLDGATDHQLAPLQSQLITLGTIDCSEEGGEYAAELAAKVANELTESLKLAFAKNSERTAWDDDIPVTATAEGSTVTVQATYTPKALPAGQYVIKQSGGKDYYTFTTSGNNSCTIRFPNDFGTYTIQDKYAIGFSSTRVNIGSTINAYVLYNGRIITSEATWESSNNEIATVDANGVITGIGLGSVQITATTDDGVTKTAPIGVSQQVMRPDFNPSRQSDGTWKVEITCGNKEATIYYSVAKDAEPGEPATQYKEAIKLTESGKYTIKAKAVKAGMIDSETVTKTVEVNVSATGVTVSPATATITGRGTAQFTATVTPATASQKVTWKLYDDKGTELSGDIAKIDPETGKVTVTGDVTSETKITVTAKTSDDKTGEAELVLKNQKDEGVTCDTTDITIAKGEKTTFKAIVKPANASNNELTLAKVGTIEGLDIIDGVPATDGTHTWTLKVTDEAKVGDYKLTVTCNSGAGETINLHIVDTSTVAPAPIFSEKTTLTAEADDITITNPTTDGTLVVFVGTEKKTVSNGEDYEYSDALADGKSVTISAYVAKGTKYQEDSQTITRTYTKDLTVTAIELNSNKPVTITGAGTEKVTVDLKPDGASKDKVTLTSSDTGVFTVKYDGKDQATLTAVAPGKAKLNASAEDGKVTKSIDVTVKKVAATAVEIQKGGASVVGSVQILKTQYAQFTAKVTGTDGTASNQAVTWTSSNTAVATVTDGKVVAVAAGTATITATSNENSAVKDTVTIIVPDTDVTSVADITFNPVTGTKLNGETPVKVTTATEGATLYYTINGDVPTTSDAVVPETGVVITTPGKVTLRVLAVKSGLTNVTAEAKYTVNIALKDVTLPGNQTVYVGETLQMAATLTPANATVKKTDWEVMNVDGGTALAAIDSKGLLTAKDKTGMVKVTVTVTLEDGKQKTASCLVTISKRPVVGLTMLPASVTLNIGDEQQLAYVATRETAKETEGVWTSSDTKVATVDRNGLVKAVAAGTATIKVAVNGKEGTATVTVLADPTSIPAKLTASQKPTYTATPSSKVYSALEGGSLSVQVGTLTPASGTTLEQLFYYYTVTVAPTGLEGFESGVNFVVAKDGAVYLNIPDVGKTSKFFDYTITFAVKDNRTTVRTFTGGNTIETKNNTLSVTNLPSAINFTAASVADTSLEGGKTATLDFGTIANYADFTATGVALTATANVSGTGVAATAAIDSNGKVTATVEGLVKGEYTVTVTLSASGCTSVTTGAAKVTVTSDKPAPVPVKKAIVVTKGTAYEGIKGVTQLAKADNYVTFDVAGLDEGVTVTSWKSSKPAYVAIDEHGIATLKKAGKAKITATMSDNSKLSIDVNVNKGSFADPADITLQTKPGNKWVDVTAEGITVVPKKSGQKSVPSRLNASDDGKIVIQDVEFSNGTIASRDGDNPSPIKVKKRSISDGETTTLTITANGAKFSVVIKVDSGAKDVYLEDVIAQIEEIIELEAE